jgi:DNA polymerase-3 subunit gamma/tau
MLPHQISGHLGKVLEAEGIPFEADALAQLGEAAQGSMRDALSLLDQAIAFGGGKVDAAGVRAMLGAVDGGHMLTLLDALATADGPRLLATAQQLLQMGVGAEAVLQELASLLYQLGLLHRVPAALNDGQRARLSPFAARFEEADLQLYYQIALHGRRDVQLAPDESAGLCMPLLRMLALAPQSPPEASTLPNMTAVSSPTPTGTFVSTPVAAGKALTEVAVATPLADTQDVAPPSAPKSKADTTTAVADDPAAIDDSPEDEPAASTPPPFEGDWPALVAALPLGAQARMLALHAALIDWQDDVFELAIAERDRFLLDAAFQSRLSDALSQWFGRTIQVRVRAAAEAEGATPAAQQQQARQRRQAEAEAVINADPFVRRLMTEFGATLIPDSLRPA